MYFKRSQYNLVKIVLYMLAIFPLADAASGMVLQGGISYGQESLPIGIIFRLILSALIIGSIIIYKNWQAISISFSICFGGTLTVILVQGIVYDYSFAQLINEGRIFGKYIVWAVIIVFFYSYRQLISKETLTQVTNISNLLLILGLIIPKLLGVGTNTYDGTVGFKGWYYGPNDTTYCLAFLTIFLVLTVQINRPNRRNVLLFCLYFGDLWALLIIGTKMGLLALVMSVVILVIRALQTWTLPILLIVILDIAAAIGIVIYFYGASIYETVFLPNIKRIQYFYQLYNGDVLRVLFSDRLGRTSNDLAILATKMKNFELLNFIGYGYDFRKFIIVEAEGLIEMDFIDTFFSYGYLGLMFLITFVVTVFRKINILQNKSIFALFLMSIIYANIAGHVLYSAMAGTTLGMLCGFLLVEG